MIVIVFVYQLKVLDTCFVYTSIKVKYKRLYLYKNLIIILKWLTFIPLRWFIKEKHNIFSIIDLELFLNWVFILNQIFIFYSNLHQLVSIHVKLQIDQHLVIVLSSYVVLYFPKHLFHIKRHLINIVNYLFPIKLSSVLFHDQKLKIQSPKNLILLCLSIHSNFFPFYLNQYL